MKTNAKTRLNVKAGIKAGGLGAINHNSSGLRVRSALKAGKVIRLANHNRLMLVSAIG